jgi:hypothetical protein
MLGLIGLIIDILMLSLILGVAYFLFKLVGKIILGFLGFGLLIFGALLFILFGISLWWLTVAGFIVLILRFIF